MLLTSFGCTIVITEVDNMSYHFGLSERQKQRVDTYGHVALTDPQAKQLSRTKSLVIGVTCFICVLMVSNRSMPAAMFSGWFAALIFKAAGLIFKYKMDSPKELVLRECLLVEQDSNCPATLR